MAFQHQLERNRQSSESLALSLRQLSPMILPQQLSSFTVMQTLQRKLDADLLNVCAYVDTSIVQYEQVEHTLSKAANQLVGMLKASKKVAPSSDSEVFAKGYLHKQLMKKTKRFHTTFSKNRNLIGYVKNGICAGVFAGFDIASVRVGRDMKYLKTSAKISLGHAQISADAKASLFQNGKIQPNLQFTAALSGALLQGSAFARIGNDYVNASGEVNVGVGVVSANAKAVINKDEIALKADVGVAAVKGQAKGVISIFGFTITATGTGELGAIGAGAEFSSKKGEFEVGGKASFLAGLGFKIKVNY